MEGFIMSAYYIERNNMSGNGGMNQPQQSGQPGGQRAPGQPGMPQQGGMQADRNSGSMPGQQSGGMQPGGSQPGGMQSGGMQSGGMQSGGMQSAAPNGAAERDYRDDLRDLLDRAHSERGLTRYRLCKQMGIDSGTLSNVLAKRRHFSLEKLEQILGLLGYRLSFTPDKAANGSGNGMSGQGASGQGMSGQGMPGQGMNGGNGMSGARPI
jgi:hypothetical protein